MKYIIATLLFFVSTILFGCTVVYKVEPSVSENPQTSVQTRPSTQTPSPTKEQRPLTIADTIQICQKIQTDDNISVGCKVEYYEGKPFMYVAFANANTLTALWKAVVRNVTAPFCAAATTSNRQAFVVAAVTDIKRASIYTCETFTWTDWYDYANTGTNRY